MDSELGVIRNRALLVLHYSLRLLIVLTPALLIWNHYGMNRVLELSAKSGHTFLVQDDRRIGGNSVATLKRSNDTMGMDCLLQKQYEWPFCHFTIELATLQNSVDLSKFDSISFDLSYTGPGRHSVRFFMRNFEDEIANLVDWQRLKPNGIEFDMPEKGEIKIPMSMVQVASWWLTERKIPILNSGIRIDRVPYVELSTGTNAAIGLHHIELKSIKFHGKWITQSHLLMLLIGAWLLFGFDKVVMELLEFRAKLFATKSGVAALIHVLRSKKERMRILQNGPPILIENNSAEKSSAQPSPEPIENSAIPSDAEEMPSSLSEEPATPASSASAPAHPTFLRWITATVGNSLRLIAVDDIHYFQSDQKYTRVVLLDSEVLIKKTLKELLAELDPEQFWKIHRSIVVNSLEIASIEPDLGGQLAVKLKTRRERLPVSEGFVKKIRQL